MTFIDWFVAAHFGAFFPGKMAKWLAWTVAILYCSEFQKKKPNGRILPYLFQSVPKWTIAFLQNCALELNGWKYLPKEGSLTDLLNSIKLTKRSFLFHYQRKLVLPRPVALNPCRVLLNIYFSRYLKGHFIDFALHCRVLLQIWHI